jgi:hypothetical protein
MMFGRIASRFQSSVLVLTLLSGSASSLFAQNHTHQTNKSQTDDQSNLLIQTIKNATSRFQNVAQAKAEGYALQFGCVSGDASGAMGLHFVNGDIVNSGVIDPSRPQIVIYEPTANGLKLTGVDFLVFADAWNAAHSSPPELAGQLFHLFEAPNRFGLPSFYTLHVWAWKDNPNGAFVNWHPNVDCKLYNGQPLGPGN